MAKFYELFYAAFTKWVEMIGQKASAKIEHSPRRERAAESLFGEFARLSSSSGEVANCFAQVNVLWKLIDWPDFRGFQLFADELIACLSAAIIRYAQLVKENIVSSTSAPANAAIESNVDSAAPPAASAIIGGHVELRQQQQQQYHRAVGSDSPASSKAKRSSINELDVNLRRLLTQVNNIEFVSDVLRSCMHEMNYQHIRGEYEKLDQLKLYETHLANNQKLVQSTTETLQHVIYSLLDILVRNKVNI